MYFFGIHPCVIITKLIYDAYIAKIDYSADTEMLRRPPATSRGKRVLKVQLLYRRKKSTLVVRLRIPVQRSLFCGKFENWDRTRQRDTKKKSQEAVGTGFVSLFFFAAKRHCKKKNGYFFDVKLGAKKHFITKCQMHANGFFSQWAFFSL